MKEQYVGTADIGGAPFEVRRVSEHLSALCLEIGQFRAASKFFG